MTENNGSLHWVYCKAGWTFEQLGILSLLCFIGARPTLLGFCLLTCTFISLISSGSGLDEQLIPALQQALLISGHFLSRMTKFLLIFIFTISTVTILAQNKMRTIEELINTTDPGWTLVNDWISKAKNKVEVLPCDPTKAKDALYQTQVTTRSPMGAVIYSTGGILVDNGWIRILGSGSSKLNRSLPDWNKGKTFKEYGERPAFLLVADDAIGGFFAINGGQFGKDAGKIYYCSPDKLKWEPLDVTYSDFLNFCFNGDLDKFYEGLRWTNWKEEVSKLAGDKVYNFYPFLWTKEGKDINKNSRKAIPVEEQYILNIGNIK